MHEIFTEKVEKSGKKLSSSKHKFSKGLSHIQELRKFVPEIDEFNRHDMESTLNDLHDILSHFYAGDEFPFTAIWELLQKLAGQVSRHLWTNGYQLLVWRIILLIENIYKAMSLVDQWYLDLHDTIKAQILSFAKQSSLDIRVS